MSIRTPAFNRDNIIMTKVTDKIDDLIDPKHTGFRHTLTFKVLIGMAALVLLGVIYNVFIRRSQTKDMNDDEKEEEAARKASLDTIDVVGDYLWPDTKPAKQDKQEDTKEEEGKPVEHVKEIPVADAATEEDIENATGQATDDKAASTTEEATKDKKVEVPKVEEMDKPTVEEIE